MAQRRWQQWRRVGIDLLLIPLCVILAIEIRFEGRLLPDRAASLALYILPITAAYIALNWLLGNYRRKWAYANFEASWLIVETVALTTLILLILNYIVRFVTPITTSNRYEVLPTSVILISAMLVLITTTGVRYRARLWQRFVAKWSNGKSAQKERAIIVGTNETLLQVMDRLPHVLNEQYLDLIGIVDSDPDIQGMDINGLPVLGTTDEIRDIVRSSYVDVVIVANPAATREALGTILQACDDISVQIRVLPNLNELLDCHYRTPLTLEDVCFDDLLDRPPAVIDCDLCRAMVRGKTVLVTGAAGSIGSELCRQLCALEPARLVAFDNNETGIFDLNMWLKSKYATPAVPVIGDVVDRSKVERVFAEFRPHLVFHAAAYKHVPIAEAFPDESVRVNIVGTINVSEIAHQYGAERFVFISTDKAVDPAGVMGASKRIGELWIASLAQRSATIFTAVRFGNVIGSRGSVFPIFRRQIDEGGPVTITHPEMKRFFMSIPEAVALVLEAAALGTGMQVFMLDMGAEIGVQELAERMIRLKGLRVRTDIPIEYVGIRPGEKLSEQLYYAFERRSPTRNPRIFALEGNRLPIDQDALLHAIADLVARLKEPCLDPELGARVLSVANQDYLLGMDQLPATYRVDDAAPFLYQGTELATGQSRPNKGVV
jgi:FlaA1/EpsC-like NDP-sugar epimerase